MVLTKKYINELFATVLVLSAVLSTASAVDCHGKSFHCVNSTHFMICVDLGGGVSQAIDNFYIACPPPTVCNGANHFECEFPAPTTPAPTTPSNVISETTLPWEEIVTTSSVGNTTKEFSENYMNTERAITVAEFSVTTDTTVVGNAFASDIYINNKLNVTEIVPTIAAKIATTQIDTIRPYISENRNITETQPTAEDITTAIIETARQNTSETWNSNQIESGVASEDSKITAIENDTQTTIENLVITETVTEPIVIATEQITQTSTLLLETAYLHTELPQVITLTQNESGTTNDLYKESFVNNKQPKAKEKSIYNISSNISGTNRYFTPILGKADVTQPTGISNNISPAETTSLRDLIAENTTNSIEHLTAVSVDRSSTDVYHSSTTAPSLENKKEKSSSANVSETSKLNTVDESSLLENKATQSIAVTDTVGETTTTFDEWMVVSGNENPTTVPNSEISQEVTVTTDASIYFQTQILNNRAKQNDKMVPKATGEKMATVLASTQNPQDASTLVEAFTTEAFENNPSFEQPTIINEINLTNYSMITAETVFIPTTISNIQPMETQAPKQNYANTTLDIATSTKNKENAASTDQPSPINKLNINTIQNGGVENITIPTSEVVNTESMSTEPVYESTTSINAQPTMIKFPLLVTNPRDLANTELEGALIIETVEITTTEHSTTINEGSGTTDTSKKIATVKNIIFVDTKKDETITQNTEIDAIVEQTTKLNEDSLTAVTSQNEFYTSDAVYPDIMSTETMYEPMTSNNAQPMMTEAPLLVTNPRDLANSELEGALIIETVEITTTEHPTTINEEEGTTNTSQNIATEKNIISLVTKKYETIVTQNTEIDAIVEQTTKLNEDSLTAVTSQNEFYTSDAVYPDIMSTETMYEPTTSNNAQPMVTEAPLLVTNPRDLANTELEGTLIIETVEITTTEHPTTINEEEGTTNTSQNIATEKNIISLVTKKYETMITQNTEIGAIVEQTTKLNEDSLTAVTSQNEFYTSDAVYPDIMSTETMYEPTTSNNAQPMMTEAPLLVTNPRDLANTELEETLIIETVEITTTEHPTTINEEEGTTNTSQNIATEKNIISLVTKKYETMITQNTEIGAIVEQTTKLNEDSLTAVTSQNEFYTSDAVYPDIMSTEAVYKSTISNNDQPMMTEDQLLLTKKSSFADTKLHEALLIETAGIASTEHPTMVYGESETTDTLKNKATENTAIQSNQAADQDSMTTKAVYTPTIIKTAPPITTEALYLKTNPHNPTANQDETTTTKTIENSVITEQSTKTNEETLTIVTTQNVAIDKIDIPTGETVNPDIMSTEAMYEFTTSINAQSMMTEPPKLVTKKPNFADKKLGGAILTEAVGIAGTEQPTILNGESDKTDTLKKVPTEKPKMQSSQPLDIITTEAAYIPTISKNTQQITNKASYFITLPKNPINTKQDGTMITHIINTDAITEQQTKKNEESSTITTTQNVGIDKISIATSEVDASTTITDSLPIPGGIPDDNISTKLLTKQTPTNKELRTNEALLPGAVDNVASTQVSFIIKKGIAIDTPQNVESIKIPTRQIVKANTTTIKAVNVPNTVNNAQTVFQDTTQLSDKKTLGSLPELKNTINNGDSITYFKTVKPVNLKQTTHILSDNKPNAGLDTTIELTTNTYVLSSTDVIELDFDKEPTTRIVGGTAKSATGVSVITDNGSNSMLLTSKNAQSDNNYQTIVNSSKSGTKLNGVNSTISYTNLEDKNHTFAVIIKKGIREGEEGDVAGFNIDTKINLSGVYDSSSNLNVTSGKSIPENLSSLQNNNYDHSKQKDSNFISIGFLSPKEESNDNDNQTFISQNAESKTTPVNNYVAYSTMQPSTVEHNEQAGNINRNQQDYYLIDQSNQNTESANVFSVSNVKVASLQNNNYYHSQQKHDTIVLSESSSPKEESHNIANQNVVSQHGEGETTPVVDHVTHSTMQPSTVERTDQASNINWNMLDNYLIDQSNQNLESMRKSSVTNAKLDENEVNAVSLDTQFLAQQPSTLLTTADRPIYGNLNNNEQSNNNIVTQEKNALLENTTDVKSLPEADYLSVPGTNVLVTKDSVNLKTDRSATIGLDVSFASATVPKETAVARTTIPDSIQNTQKIIASFYYPPLKSKVDETRINVTESGSIAEFSLNKNENIVTNNKDTSNVVLSKISDTKPHNLTPGVIEDGIVDSPTVESNNLPSQSVTNQYELPTHFHDYSEITRSTPYVNQIEEVDKSSKPMLDVLPLPINNIKLSTSVTNKPLLIDSTPNSQTKHTIIINESYKSTTLNPIYANTRIQPSVNVVEVTTARTIVDPTFNIQARVNDKAIANTKNPVAGGYNSLDNSKSVVNVNDITTASTIKGASLNSPTGRTDSSQQHSQGSVDRTNPIISISRTEVSETETITDNRNTILSPNSSGDVHVGITSESVPEEKHEVHKYKNKTEISRSNIKTETQQNNSSTNLTSSMFIQTQEIYTGSVLTSAQSAIRNPMPHVNNNVNTQVSKDTAMMFSCISGIRGRYSDKEDCRKFYICVGNNLPIVGNCPENTVFSDFKKLCTKNLSHCIRDDEFKCPSAGRFSDFVKDNVYYICVNHKNHLYKFKFQCQKGFILNTATVKCIETKEIESNESVSISSNDNSSQTGSTSTISVSISISRMSNSSSSGNASSNKNEVPSKSKKSNEAEETSEKEEEDDDDEVFKCKKEGRFPIRNECRRYYLCKKRRSEYRRKIKKCESGRVFHKDKKKCVDADSYEC